MVEHPAHAVGDGEPEPQSLLALLVAGGLVQAAELLEDLRLLGFRYPRARVPHLDGEAPPLAAAAQQHAAFLGVADGVGEEVLDDPAQHLGVAVDPGAGRYHHQVEAAVLGHHLELGAQRADDVGQREVGAPRGEGAGIELGDVEQGAEQLLGGLQGVVDVADGALHVAGVHLLGERRGEQARGVEGLQQVVAGGGQEAGLGGVGVLRHLLGLAQGLLRLGAYPVLLAQGRVGLGERQGALAHPLLQSLVGLLEGDLRPAPLGDVLVEGEEAEYCAAVAEVGGIGHQHVAASLGEAKRDLEADPLAGQGPLDPGGPLPGHCVVDHLLYPLADHRVAVDAEGLLVGAVGEEVAALLVEVGDQRRHVVRVDADIVLRADQRLLDALLLGDVLVGVDEAAAGHGVALHLQHAAVLAVAHVAVGLAVADIVEQQLDVLLGVAGAVFAVVGVVAEDLVDGGADPDQVVREAEQLQVALVPHHQAQVLVHHADALVDVLDGGLEQGAVELQHLGGLVDDGDHVGDADAAPLQRRVDHDARRGGAEHRGQEALGELDHVDGGAGAVLQGLAAAPRVVVEGAAHLVGPQEALAEHLEVAHGGGAGPGAVYRGLAGLDAVDEQRGLDALHHPLGGDLGDEDVAEEVHAQGEHHAVGEAVTHVEAEQRGGGEPGDAQGAAVEPVGGEYPGADHRRHQQAVGPDQEAGVHADDHPQAVAALPVEAADQCRGELAGGGKGEHADGGQGGELADQVVEAVGHGQHRGDGHASRPQHQAAVVAGLGVEPAQAEQRRDDDLVGDHDRDRHGRDDHHAGGRREAADEGEQGEPGALGGHGQRQHVGVGLDVAVGEQGQAGGGQRQDEEGEDEQVEGEEPARLGRIVAVGVLHHRHVELARQAEYRQHRQQGLGPEALAEVLLGQLALQLQLHIGVGQQLAEPAEHSPGHVGAEHQEGEQLDQRLEGHGVDHPLVVLGGIGVAGPEEDGEGGHHHRHVEGGVGEQRRMGRIPVRGEHAEGGGDRLELQGDVGQGADQRHQAGEGGEGLGLAVAGGDEVGDGGDVLVLGDADHLGQHRPEQQEGEDRADIDAGEGPAPGGGLAGGAVEAPGGAVDGQRQAVDDGATLAGAVLPGATVASPGDAEQHGDVEQ